MNKWINVAQITVMVVTEVIEIMKAKQKEAK